MRDPDARVGIEPRTTPNRTRLVDDDGPDATRRNACAALVALAAREGVPGIVPRRFIERLGHAGAGIRPGVRGLVDLALAGENRLPGHGFRAELDDGTAGQARHFCGIAASCARFGPRLTWWVSVHLRRDAPDTPDGRLTDLAIAFVESLLGGELGVGAAPEWLRRELCDRVPPFNSDEPDEPDEPGPPTTPA